MIQVVFLLIFASRSISFMVRSIYSCRSLSVFRFCIGFFRDILVHRYKTNTVQDYLSSGMSFPVFISGLKTLLIWDKTYYLKYIFYLLLCKQGPPFPRRVSDFHSPRVSIPVRWTPLFPKKQHLGIPSPFLSPVILRFKAHSWVTAYSDVKYRLLSIYEAVLLLPFKKIWELEIHPEKLFYIFDIWISLPTIFELIHDWTFVIRRNERSLNGFFKWVYVTGVCWAVSSESHQSNASSRKSFPRKEVCIHLKLVLQKHKSSWAFRSPRRATDLPPSNLTLPRDITALISWQTLAQFLQYVVKFSWLCSENKESHAMCATVRSTE